MPKADKKSLPNGRMNGKPAKKSPGKPSSSSRTPTKSKQTPPNHVVEEDPDPDFSDEDTEGVGDDEMPNPGVPGPGDDPRERRQLRHEYRNLMEETQKNRQDLINPEKEDDQLHEFLRRQNEMFQRVKHTREAALDSTQLATVAHLAKQKAQNLHTDFVVFQPYEFAEKLITFLSGHRLQDQSRTKISREGWEKLGEAVQPFFKRSPPIHYMFGAFERGPPADKKRKKKSDRSKEDGANDKPQAVKNINNSLVNKEEATTQEVEKILGYLQSYYDMWKRQPICFFEFVINPESFGQTIENIFYASFLVRDGFARVFLDEDRLPVIEPVEVQDNGEGESERKHQVVMSITYQQWKEIIETFNIERPLIPTRSPTSPKNSPEKLREIENPRESPPLNNNSPKSPKATKKGKGKGKNNPR